MGLLGGPAMITFTDRRGEAMMGVRPSSTWSAKPTLELMRSLASWWKVIER